MILNSKLLFIINIFILILCFYSIFQVTVQIMKDNKLFSQVDMNYWLGIDQESSHINRNSTYTLLIPI